MSETQIVTNESLSERLNRACEGFFHDYGRKYLLNSDNDRFHPKQYERQITGATPLIEQDYTDNKNIIAWILVETGYPIRIFFKSKKHEYTVLPDEYQGFPVREDTRNKLSNHH